MSGDKDSGTTEVKVLVPASMRLISNPDTNGSCILEFAQSLGTGSLILAEEGSETVVTIGAKVFNKIKEACQSSEVSVLTWPYFADRCFTLDESNLVPTVVFGRGALVARKPVNHGDPVKVLCNLNINNEYGKVTSEASLQLSSSLVSNTNNNVSIETSSVTSAATPCTTSLLALIPQSFHLQQQQQQQYLGGLLPHQLFIQQQQQNNIIQKAGAPGRRAREKTMLPCQICGKAFDRPSLLKRHMRTHTGEKPHICEVCNKGFSTSSSLNTHRRIHSGEKPHQCGICGKRFTASSNLYYHRMTHNKDKPHKCQLCDKSFPTPGDLKTHQVIHSSAFPYRCHICNQGFAKHITARNHILAHLSGMHIPDIPRNVYPVSTTSPIKTSEASSSSGLSLTSAASPASSSFLSSSPILSSDTNKPMDPSTLMLLTCPICREIMPNVSAMQLHLRTHLLLMQPATALKSIEKEDKNEEDGNGSE